MNPDERLVELHCVPTALIHFGTDEDTGGNDNYLKADLADKLSSPSAALDAAAKSRFASFLCLFSVAKHIFAEVCRRKARLVKSLKKLLQPVDQHIPMKLNERQQKLAVHLNRQQLPPRLMVERFRNGLSQPANNEYTRYVEPMMDKCDLCGIT